VGPIAPGSFCPPRTPNSCPIGIATGVEAIDRRRRRERSFRPRANRAHLKIRLRKQIDEARSLQQYRFQTIVLVWNRRAARFRARLGLERIVL
jgi:hypothetical protein